MPNANVTFGGTGTDRTVTIITAPGSTIQTATVTVTASDGTDQTVLPIGVVVGTTTGSTLTGSDDAY